jgi:hypothetical protein
MSSLTLTLSPTKAAVNRKLAGFHQGTPLKLSFKAGETCEAVLHRFNEYRSPDNHIERLLTSANLDFPLKTVLMADQVLYVP